MDKKEKSQMGKRIAMSFGGVILAGFCIGAFQKSNLGADPYTCFVTGIAGIFHSGYSTFFFILTAVLLLGVFALDRHYIGAATLINLVFTGIAADFMRNTLDVVFPDPNMAVRIVMMVLGLIGTCFAASMYFTVDMGVSGYDACALIAANKYKVTSFRMCRIITDCICVLTGLAFHVTIGVGTVMTALFMGPVVQWFNTNVSEPMLYGKKHAFLPD